jgi:hypothetical protein
MKMNRLIALSLSTVLSFIGAGCATEVVSAPPAPITAEGCSETLCLD